MKTLSVVAIIVLSITCAVIIFRYCSVKKGAREIVKETRRILNDDTNGLITVSSGDKDMRLLASELNSQLASLREIRLSCKNGDRELKKAITNISHDLRTPLTAILGYIQMLNGETDVEKYREYVSIIGSRAQKMKELTEELFAYTILTSPEKELTLTKTDLRGILEECIVENFVLLTQSEISPEISIPDSPVLADVDCASLRRVFTNIISNAAKYSDGDLVITMSSEGETVFENSASKLTEIQTSKLFDRFFTVEDGRRSTGLGLSIAKHLTKQMNGRISAEYLPGRLRIRVAFK